jgi:hypothetical protein
MMAIAYINDPAMTESIKEIQKMLFSKKASNRYNRQFNQKQQTMANRQRPSGNAVVVYLKHQYQRCYACGRCREPPAPW